MPVRDPAVTTPDSAFCQVMTTIDTRERASLLARSLVESRLAACVQVLGPIASTYRWRGAVQEDEEWLLLVKTSTDRYPELERHVRARHPYEVPEILCTPVTAGNPGYLDWLAAQTRTGTDQDS